MSPAVHKNPAEAATNGISRNGISSNGVGELAAAESAEEDESPALEDALLKDSLPEDAGSLDEPPLLTVSGAQLTAEELAALSAVVGKLATAEPEEEHGAGSTGPRDRTLQRRRRLGLWGRPGSDSWKHAAGLR